jgi:hypothetical protein
MSDTWRSDPIRVCAESFFNVAACRARVEAIAALLRKVADGIEKRPTQFCFSDERPGEENVPGDYGRTTDWPDAAGIRKAIDDWHHAAARFMAAWEALPQQDRELIRARPETAGLPPNFHR